MPDFFTDEQGRVRPVRGKKGGGFIAAAAVGLVISVAGSSVGGVGADAGGSVASKTLHARTTSSKDAARRGHRDQAWRRMKLKRLKRTVKRSLRCAVRSFGQVQEFFLRTPCRSLRRVLLALGDGHGTVIAVALAWVRMPNAARAKRFKKLEDTYGTGDISPIAGEALAALGGVRFTGKHYWSRRSGSLTVVAETEPLTGHPTAELLKALAQVAAQLPPL